MLVSLKNGKFNICSDLKWKGIGVGVSSSWPTVNLDACMVKHPTEHPE